MNCLLCYSNNVPSVEKHKIENLKILWSSSGIDVSKELYKQFLEIYKCTNCGLGFFDPSLAGGDDFYSALGKFDWYYNHPGKTEYDFVQQYIKDGLKVLDIGSGRGVLYSKINKKVEYTGIELSTKAVELATADGINVIKENLAVHSKRHENFYDIVCLFQVLEHMTELGEFIESIFKTLKSQGLLVIAVPDNDGFASKTPNYTFNLPPHHTILWTEKSLRYLAKKYNFEVVTVDRELLQDIHKEIAYNSFIIWRIKKFFYLPSNLLDTTIYHRIITKVVNFISKNSRIKNFMFEWASKYQINGQSIITVLKKR
jgi:2-polyprenyl-3-methyl-5-hydroxy-6-metoxy-1,4-benzoquinol methylase